MKELAFDKRFYVGEDSLFWAESLKKARKLYYVHDTVYHYVHHLESACRGSFNLKKITEIYAWEEICKLYHNSNTENILMAILATKIMGFCFRYYLDPAFLESGCLDELIIKYRKIQSTYFEELIRTRKYRELFKGIVFGICPKLYLKCKEKKSLLSK